MVWCYFHLKPFIGKIYLFQVECFCSKVELSPVPAPSRRVSWRKLHCFGDSMSISLPVLQQGSYRGC